MRRKCWLLYATPAIVSAVAVRSDAQTFAVDLVAEIGDPVPDSATLMRGFGSPVIDATGRIVFQVNVGQVIPSLINFQTVGLSSQVIRMPDAAPGFFNDMGDPLFFLSFSSGPLMNAAGTLAFTSAIRDESGSASIGSVLFAGTSVDNLGYLARSDTLNLPASVQTHIPAFVLNTSGTAAFISGGPGAQPVTHAVFRTEGASDATLIALEGAHAPGTPTDAVFFFFSQDSLVINARGDVAFRGTLLDGAGGVTFDNNEGIWCYCNSALQLVARKGDVAPGDAFGNPFKGFLDKTAISPTGEVAFQGRLGNSFSPSGIWRGTSTSDLRAAAVTATPKPTSLGYSDNLFSFSGPVFNSDSELLFSANGVTTTDAIWKEVGGILQPIFKSNVLLSDGTFIPGDAATGTAGTFFDFGRFTINPSGSIAFKGNYDGSGWSTPRGIWAQAADGFLEDILRPGDVVQTQRGSRTITNAFFLDGPGPTSGKSTGFSDRFELALLATFDTNLSAIIRAPVGDIPPPGNLYIWSGAAGNNIWDTIIAETTNWIDARGLQRFAPGNTGLEIVLIQENIPANGVLLIERSVSIGRLIAEGGLTVAQPLTLANDSSIESLQMDAGLALNLSGNEMINTRSELTLFGDSVWRLGWINSNNSRVLNQGTLTIDGSVNRTSAQAGGITPPRRVIGNYTNVANTLQKNNVDLNNATVENLSGGTWTLVKGSMTVGLGGGRFDNAGDLIKPDTDETADSAIDAFYTAKPTSKTDVDAGKLTLRGGAEFQGGAKILLNKSRTQVNVAETSELELAAAGAANRTYKFIAGKTIINLSLGLIFQGDGIFRLSPGATLSVSNDGELELNNVKFMLDGGDIVGPGKIETSRGTVSWNSGTIGRSDLGVNSANVVLGDSILNILTGPAKTLAGTLSIPFFSGRVSQAADLIIDGGKVVLGAGTWTIRGNSSVMGNSGGQFVVDPTSSGTLSVDVDKQATFSAALDNRGTVEVNSGRLLLTGPIEQVSGTVLTGGEWEVNSRGSFESTPPVLDMVNHTINTIGKDATVTIGLQGSFPQLQAGINDGELDVRNGGVLQLAGLINNGEVTVWGDNTTKLIISNSLTNNGTLNILSCSVVQVGNVFESQAGSTNTIDGSLTAAILRFLGGKFSGNGFINGELLENILARLGPGGSAGILTVNANYVQSSTAALDIELGGLIPGVEHDQLVINGDATLAGTLLLVPLKGFLPLVGQSYEILTVTGGTLTGEFDSIVGPGEYGIAYAADGVTVTVLAMPGDSDTDNDLDLFDYRDLTECVTGPGATAAAECSVFDMNADNSIDLLDWCIFQTIFTGP